jgi:acyl-CoA synthetase (AMP-forming)/AMP-acid ligase II
VKEKRTSLYYLFEKAVKHRANRECIWSREGCYTWNQAYDRVNQYGHWFLAQGVRPRDLVAFYMQNSPDFIFAWLGLWSIGAAPAMINYNLSGKALLHCLKISGAKLMLIDYDQELRNRIDDVGTEIVNELGITPVVIGKDFKRELLAMTAERPEDTYRADVQGNWPICLFYTRYLFMTPLSP